MKKYLKIIIPLILICITGLVIYHFVSKVKLNSSYVNGNTAGNLYNAGSSVKVTVKYFSQIQTTTAGCMP